MQQEHTNLDEAARDLIIEPRDREQTYTKVQVVGGRAWNSQYVEYVEVSDHWPLGRSAQPSDFVQIGLKKSAYNCIEVSVDGAEPKPVDSVALTFRGDSEIHAAIASFELLVRKLRAISEVRDP